MSIGIRLTHLYHSAVQRYDAAVASGMPPAQAYRTYMSPIPDKTEAMIATRLGLGRGWQVSTRRPDERHIITEVKVGDDIVFGRAFRTQSRFLEGVLVKVAALAVGYGIGVATWRLGVSAMKSLATLSLKQAAVRGLGAYALYQFGPSTSAALIHKLTGIDVATYVQVGTYAYPAYSTYTAVSSALGAPGKGLDLLVEGGKKAISAPIDLSMKAGRAVGKSLRDQWQIEKLLFRAGGRRYGTGV
jgi:hypothetical protein